MAANDHGTARFRHFFLRGLTFLLPTILTIWIFYAAYGFVMDRIARPINAGIREAVIRTSTTYPYLSYDDPKLAARFNTWFRGDDKASQKQQWLKAFEGKEWVERIKTWTDTVGRPVKWSSVIGQTATIELDQDEITQLLKVIGGFRRGELKTRWYQIGFPLDVIGLLIGIILIYVLGRFVGSYLGGKLYRRGEDLLQRTPVIKQVYPYVKQVTDFVVGSSQEKLKFKRVVAVEYPRKGVWSMGLVTGDPIISIQSKVAEPMLTVFVPSSPTPFTGYVITVPADETIDLHLTIDQALKFTISGGVLTPTDGSGPIQGQPPDGPLPRKAAL